MNKEILASLNEICEELEDLGMEKESSIVNDIFLKIAQNKRVTVFLLNGKPAIKIEGRKRPILGPQSGPFTSASHARNYAAKITPNYIDEIPHNVMPGRSWTKDDQEMYEFEASREEKY